MRATAWPSSRSADVISAGERTRPTEIGGGQAIAVGGPVRTGAAIEEASGREDDDRGLVADGRLGVGGGVDMVDPGLADTKLVGI